MPSFESFEAFSTMFLDSFSAFNERISDLPEKIESNTISSEKFLNEIYQSSESTIKTLEQSFSTLSEQQNTIKDIKHIVTKIIIL